MRGRGEKKGGGMEEGLGNEGGGRGSKPRVDTLILHIKV